LFYFFYFNKIGSILRRGPMQYSYYYCKRPPP
jgi:hypothetical protein